jgi:NADPH:quinone reductase-like Zn-dependent oxidoreductase
VDQGAISPLIDRVYPLAQTPEALAYSQTGRAKGKIVIAVK